MAEEFLTLMADLDDETQVRMSQWYDILKKAGFAGAQTPGLPYHISLAMFSLDYEQDAAALTKRIAAGFSTIPIHISHIGLLSGGKILFCAPERNAKLDALHDACDPVSDQQHPWTPHITMMIDESDIICSAMPLFVKSFQPLLGRITRLHLCAFWPTREVLSAELNGET